MKQEIFTSDEIESLYDSTMKKASIGGCFKHLPHFEQRFIKQLLTAAVEYEWERAEKDPLNNGAPIHRKSAQLADELTQGIGEFIAGKL